MVGALSIENSHPLSKAMARDHFPRLNERVIRPEQTSALFGRSIGFKLLVTSTKSYHHVRRLDLDILADVL